MVLSHLPPPQPQEGHFKHPDRQDHWCDTENRLVHAARVRDAVEHNDFSRPLGEIIEIDEHYNGESTKSGKRGRGAEAKTPIVSMVEREGEIRLQAVGNCKNATLIPIIRQYVKLEENYVITDEGFLSHLKFGIHAIQIHVPKKHLNCYCKEYEFLYKHSGISDLTRFCEWFRICDGRLTCKRLIV